MILLIDVGNTNIVFGISDGEKIVNTLRTETIKDADFDYVPILQDLLCKKEKIGKKIREAELQRIPYIVVLGEQESNEGLVAVRARGGVDMGKMSLEAFVAHLEDELSRSFEIKKQ